MLFQSSSSIWQFLPCTAWSSSLSYCLRERWWNSFIDTFYQKYNLHWWQWQAWWCEERHVSSQHCSDSSLLLSFPPSWHHFYKSPSVSSSCCGGVNSRLWVRPNEPLSYRLWLFLVFCKTLHLLNAGLKCAQQGAIIQPAQLRPELNTDLALCSVICCRLLLPGDNCIAVSLWLMSCWCNCFTVWPLVFQTRGLVKDLLCADEEWDWGWGTNVFRLVCLSSLVEG